MQHSINLTHIQFSGVGGHLREFAAFAQAGDKSLSQSAVFYGNLPVCEELLATCGEARIPYSYVKRKRGRLLLEVLQVLAALWKFSPDVVLVRGSETIPIVFFFSLLRRCKVVCVETQATKLKTPKQILLSKLSMILSDAVVVLTQSYLSELSETCGRFFQQHKVQVIPNGIDVNYFHKMTNLPRKSDQFRIGMQSRVVSAKEHDVLLRAFSLLPRNAPDGRQLFLSIAGDGELLPEIRALSRELGISSRTLFDGELSGNELLHFTNSLDLYVQATKGETFCFSVFEALACELPVIVARVPVLDRLLERAPGVRFYDQGNSGSLAHAIRAFLEETASGKGIAGRKFVVANFSSQKMIKRYQELFSSLYRKPSDLGA